MICGHWLVLSDNYFDRMMLSIRKPATQWKTYSPILRDPVILFCINSLIIPVGMNFTGIRELQVTGVREEFLIFKESGRAPCIPIQHTVLHSPLQQSFVLS